MMSFQGVLSISLLLVTAIFATPRESNWVAIAQSNQDQQLGWESIFNNNPPPVEERPAGGRGDICIITPYETQKGIWSDRPLFVWKGKLNRIEVHTTDSDRVLWKKELQATDRTTSYQGEELEPGKNYYWMLFDMTSNESSYPTDRVTFRVMNEDERRSITADLMAMESQLKSKKVTEEQIAYERAKYFVEKQLLADALQQVYRVKNPSAGLLQFRQSLEEKMCR